MSPQSDQLLVPGGLSLLDEIIAMHSTNYSKGRPAEHDVHEPNGLTNADWLYLSVTVLSKQTFLVATPFVCSTVNMVGTSAVL